MPGTVGALHLTQPQSSLVFTTRSYRDFFYWHRNLGLGGLVWIKNPLLLRGASVAEISLLTFTCHTWVWDQPVPCFCAPPASLSVASSLNS